MSKRQLWKCQKDNVVILIFSNTDINDTDCYPSYPILSEEMRTDGNEKTRIDKRDREEYRKQIKENIDYEVLVSDDPDHIDILDEILNLMVDVVCANTEYIRVSGDDKPADTVRSQFLKLDSGHIKYVIDALQENTTKIRNMRQYLIAALYNAPMTIGNYYRSLVNHDMYGKKTGSGNGGDVFG